MEPPRLPHPQPLPTPQPLPDYLVADVENARMLAGGTQAASMTSAQILQNIQSRARTANMLQMSDLATGGRTSAGLVLLDDSTVTCSGATCTFRLIDGTPEVRLSIVVLDSYPIFGTSGLDLARFNAQSSVAMAVDEIIMVQGRGAAQGGTASAEFVSYGGWLTGSVFGLEAIIGTPSEEDRANGVENVYWYASYSFGNNIGTNPSSGTAQWDGVMVGTTQTGDIVQGLAVVDIDDFNNPEVDVEFNSIRNLDTGAIVTNMGWTNMTLMNGNFSHTSSLGGHIQGAFYGSIHDEVGGIFDRNDIIGAYGATR